eukprot:3094506-Prymnesium_polylepis.1
MVWEALEDAVRYLAGGLAAHGVQRSMGVGTTCRWRPRGPCAERCGRWPMLSPKAISGHYARPAVPLAR